MRSREEAAIIVRQLYGDLNQMSFSQLVYAYQQTDERYCNSCHKTGRTFKKIEDGSILFGSCICKQVIDQKKKHEISMQQTGIPRKYHDADVNKWVNCGANFAEQGQNETNMMLVRTYLKKLDEVKQRGVGLFICGPNGVGKTYIACAIGIRAIRRLHTVRYCVAPDVVKIHADGWKDDNVRNSDDELNMCDFLIVDDIGKVYASKSGFETYVIERMIRNRVQAGRPCIITANMNYAALREHYGDSFKSIMDEACVKVVLVGEDYRKKVADENRKFLQN